MTAISTTTISQGAHSQNGRVLVFDYVVSFVIGLPGVAGIDYMVGHGSVFQVLAISVVFKWVSRMCLPLPIDIVYTWVNGSDPRLMADLAQVKYQLELEHNLTEKAKQTQLLLEKFRNQSLAEQGMGMSSVGVEQDSSTTTILTSTSTTTTVTTTTASNASQPWNGTLGDYGNVSVANITVGASPSLVAPDVKTLILSSPIKLQVWGDSVQSVIHDHVRETCGSLKGLQLDSEGYSALAVFEHEDSARACLARSQLDVALLNASFVVGPVSYCGGHTMHGLFPLKLSPAANHFDGTDVDDPIGFAAYSVLCCLFDMRTCPMYSIMVPGWWLDIVCLEVKYWSDPKDVLTAIPMRFSRENNALFRILCLHVYCAFLCMSKILSSF